MAQDERKAKAFEKKAEQVDKLFEAFVADIAIEHGIIIIPIYNEQTLTHGVITKKATFDYVVATDKQIEYYKQKKITNSGLEVK